MGEWSYFSAPQIYTYYWIIHSWIRFCPCHPTSLASLAITRRAGLTNGPCTCVVPSLRSAPPTPKLPDHDHATAAAPRCAAPPVGLGEKKIEPPSIFLMQVGQAVPNVRHFLYEVSRITKNGKTSSDIRRFLITFEAGPGGLS